MSNVDERRGPDEAARPPQAERGNGAVELGRGEEPPPLKWMVANLAPLAYLTILYGAGGLGKSYLAMHLALCVILGRDFLGHEVERGRVLWIDAEHLGRDEVERRAFQIARALGLDRPPEGLLYYVPSGSISSDRVLAEIREIVESEGIALIVLDSLTMGAVGTDVSAQRETVEMTGALSGLGVTIVALDHVPKSAGPSGSTIFGSVFKRNAARSTLHLHKKDGQLVIRQDKSNFGPEDEGIVFRMKFSKEDGRTTVRIKRETGEISFRFRERPYNDKVAETLETFKALAKEQDEPVTVPELVEATGNPEGTVRNHLTELRKANEVESDNKGNYTLVDPLEGVVFCGPDEEAEDGDDEGQEVELEFDF